MLICNECLEDNFENTESMIKSSGKCEWCEDKKVCNDIPSKYLEKKIKHTHELTIHKINFGTLAFDELLKVEVNNKNEIEWAKVSEAFKVLSREKGNNEYVVKFNSIANPLACDTKYADEESINLFYEKLK